MKNILTLLLIIIICHACKAQSYTVPMYDTPSSYIYHNDNDGIYYKDTHNDLNLFEGTWLYTNGNTSFKVVLEKKVMHHINEPDLNMNYYKDLLFGEYQYIENGVTKVNTLSAMTLNIDPFDHNLNGGWILKYNPNVPEACPGCNPGDVMVGLLFDEPNIEIEGSNVSIYLRLYTENGIEKLEARLIETGLPTYNINDTAPLETYSVPLSTYILVKQP